MQAPVAWGEYELRIRAPGIETSIPFYAGWYSSADASETPDFHRHLAKKAGIDPISYLYEVLESHEISFSQASGLAADFCQNAHFDWQGFAEARRAAGEWENILAIVQDKITAQALEADAELKAVLLAVYRAGAASVR